MNIFKSKGIIRLYAFITACMIVITIIATSTDAFASSQVTNYNVLNDYNISDYIMPYDANDEFEKFGCGSDSDNATWYLKALNKGVWSFSGVYQNPAEYPHFFVTSFTRKPVNDHVTHIKFFQMPEDAFVLFLNRGYYVMIPNIPSDYRGYDFEMDNESDVYLNDFINDRRGDTKSFGGIPYQAIYVSNYNSSTEAPIINGDVPYYHMNVDYLVDVPSSNSAFDEQDNGNNSSDFGGVGNVSSEQWENLQYLTGQSGIYFQTSNCNNGVVQFVAQYPNDLENPEEYTIKITGTCNYNVTKKSITDVQFFKVLKNYVSISDASYSGTYDINASHTSGMAWQGNQIIDPTNKSLIYYGNSINNIKLSDFNNNMYVNNAPISYLAEYITSNTQRYWQGGIDAFTDSMSSSIGGNSIATIKNFSSDKFEINDIYYTFTMALYDPDNVKVGEMSATYDMIEGEQIDGADTLTVSNDDVSANTSGGSDYYGHSTDFNTNYNDGSGGSGGGSGSGSGGSVIGGDNNIVINNNPTFNNDVNGGGSGSGNTESDASLLSFFNTFNPFKTIFNKLSGNNEVIADDTAETIGANRFITVISNTFGFIPTEIWTTLAWFLGASLAILIVAVVLRIILDLL